MTGFFDSIAKNVQKEVKKQPKTEEIKSVSSKVDFSELLKQSEQSSSHNSQTVEQSNSFKPIKKSVRKSVVESEAKSVVKSNDENVIKPKRVKKTKVEKSESFGSLLDFVIQGAKDIIAEDVSDHANLREEIKNYESINANIKTEGTKTFDPEGVYKIYGNYSKKISDIPSYAYLAICRAEKEKQINVDFQTHAEKIEDSAKKYFLPSQANTSRIYLEEAIQDGLKRLLMPSIEREIRSDKKRWADEAAIKVFGENMKNLLLTPPVAGLTVLGYDPGFRTGCKIAVVDKTGKFLENTVVYATEPQKEIEKSEKILIDLITKHNVDLIVIGNGTASRESEKFIANMIKKHKLSVQYAITSEAGASVYSASELGQEEYPNLDVTVRGAISIAHRVQDPLAELTKITPKSIGVGQYQHDVDQDLLQQKLDEKVQDTVNAVGVDVNTASYTLLQYVAGLSKKIAQNIVKYRDQNGPFQSKKELKKVDGLGPKAYEQAVGFLRIKNGKEILDSTGIHPDHHDVTYKILEEEFNIKKKDLKLPLILDVKNIGGLSEKYGIGIETLKDIFKELARPGLDPRDNLPTPNFKSDVLELSDVKVGMVLEGVVRNVTDFGAFVDIGLHNDGLVHISEITNRFISNPSEVLAVGQPVKAQVIKIDEKNEKVSLSMKSLEDPSEVKFVPREKKEVIKVELESDQEENDYSGFSSGIKSNISFS